MDGSVGAVRLGLGLLRQRTQAASRLEQIKHN
jgi:hypothetical protein